MKTTCRLAAILLVVKVLLGISPALAEHHFLAYSLGEAENLLKQKSTAAPELLELGSMTRIIGVVYDQENRDWLLVGLVNPGNPKIHLDDLVVALRSVMVHKQWPRVSIDKTPDTKTTGRQAVVFAGGVAGTRFGLDLLEADVILKKLALGELTLPDKVFRSYFDLHSDNFHQTGQDQQVHSRFWFKEGNCYLADREGVAVVEELQLAVKTEVLRAVGPTGKTGDLLKTRDELGERFSAALTQRFSLACQHYPQIRRLNTLFSLVGVAAAMQKVQGRMAGILGPGEFWLNQYQIQPAQTPQDFPLLVRRATLEGPGKVRVLTIDGGIELKSLMLDLNDGSISALRDIVIKSRPSGKPLTWRLPLEGWQLPGFPPTAPGTTSETGSSEAKGKIGCTLTTQFFPSGSTQNPQSSLFMENYHPAPIPSQGPNFISSDRLNTSRLAGLGGNLGGIYMAPEPKKIGTGGQEVKKETLGSRPAEDSLSWPLSQGKGGK